MFTDEQLSYVDIPCSRCGKNYTEFKIIDRFVSRHPSCLPICISCDPRADRPALVAVTTKGRNAILVEPEVYSEASWPTCN